MDDQQGAAPPQMTTPAVVHDPGRMDRINTRYDNLDSRLRTVEQKVFAIWIIGGLVAMVVVGLAVRVFT